uniref:Putative peptide chain release factor C12orf65, mitochondrial n=1 Tax=Lygus hesperus TaxID=30085 RepID=A0A146MFL0_LYGHE
MFRVSQVVLRRFHSTPANLIKKIDYTKVPVLNEKDIEEQFIAGSGPGGSNVAKNNNCALLRHAPTGSFSSLVRSCSTSSQSRNKDVDRSLVPVLNEDEIDEQFVKGSGPGGQNVNKRANCVVLRHLPSGIVVKCHESRLLETNRKLAREKLVTKLDDLVNGENSVKNQIKALNEKKSSAAERKKKKLRDLKERWKEREGLL